MTTTPNYARISYDLAREVDRLTAENERLRADRNEWLYAAQAARGHYEQSDERLAAVGSERDALSAVIDNVRALRDRWQKAGHNPLSPIRELGAVLAAGLAAPTP